MVDIGQIYGLHQRTEREMESTQFPPWPSSQRAAMRKYQALVVGPAVLLLIAIGLFSDKFGMPKQIKEYALPGEYWFWWWALPGLVILRQLYRHMMSGNPLLDLGPRREHRREANAWCLMAFVASVLLWCHVQMMETEYLYPIAATLLMLSGITWREPWQIRDSGIWAHGRFLAWNRIEDAAWTQDGRLYVQSVRGPLSFRVRDRDVWIVPKDKQSKIEALLVKYTDIQPPPEPAPEPESPTATEEPAGE